MICIIPLALSVLLSCISDPVSGQGASAGLSLAGTLDADIIIGPGGVIVGVGGGSGGGGCSGSSNDPAPSSGGNGGHHDDEHCDDDDDDGDHCKDEKPCCSGEKKCPCPNEVYKDCGYCDRTCYDYDKPICPKKCPPGCYCKDGYVRNEDNQCIKPDCCPKCKNCTGCFEMYYECGPKCPCTCEDYKDRDDCYDFANCDKKSWKDCCPGCYCIPPTVRNKDGYCVPTELCCDCDD